jgi:hypothetical protein
LRTQWCCRPPISHFADRGYVRVAGAFTSVQAASMRDVVWDALARDGIVRNDPSTRI